MRRLGSRGAQEAAGSWCDPNCGNRRGRGTALDYVIGTYARSPRKLSACIDVPLAAGGTTRVNAPGVLEVLRGQLDRLTEQLDGDPELVNRRFPNGSEARRTAAFLRERAAIE